MLLDLIVTRQCDLAIEFSDNEFDIDAHDFIYHSIGYMHTDPRLYELIMKLISKGVKIKSDPIFRSVRTLNVDIVKVLLDLGTYEDKSSPLKYAVLLNQLDIVKLLIDHGYKIEGELPIPHCIKNCSMDIIKLLINSSNVNDVYDGKNALYYAICQKNDKLVEFLADLGIDKKDHELDILYANTDLVSKNMLNSLLKRNMLTEDDIQTVIELAVDKNYYETTVLINNYFNIRQHGLLAIAINNDYQRLVELFINLGVNVNDRSICSNIALHYLKTNTKIMELVLSKTNDINTKNAWLQTSLDVAIDADNVDATTFLINSGANIDPLSLLNAVKKKSHNVLELIAGHVNIEEVDGDGNTALHIASKCGHMGMVRTLLKFGAKVNSTNKNGNTPLHLYTNNALSCYYQISSIKRFVDHGANIGQHNNEGFTPLRPLLFHEYHIKRNIKFVTSVNCDIDEIINALEMPLNICARNLLENFLSDIWELGTNHN